MRNNKEFENILDDCLQTMLTGSGTIDDCLKRYPEQAVELEPLLKTAMSVSEAIDLQPRPEFKARARYQLQLKMAESKSKRRVSFFGAQPRWALASLGVMVVFLLGTGTVFAANSSMPDSPLYPVKLATENMRVAVAASDIEKAQLYATYADRRMVEMSQMTETGKTQNIETVAKRFNEDINKMANVPLSKNHDSEPETMSVTTVPSAAAKVPMTPTIMNTTTPPMVPKGRELPTPPTAKTRSPENTAPIVASPTAASHPTSVNDNKDKSDKNAAPLSNVDKLKQTIAYYSKMHPAELRKLLESNKIPESAKPAMRRALYASEHGYEQTLKDLGN